MTKTFCDFCGKELSGFDARKEIMIVREKKMVVSISKPEICWKCAKARALELIVEEDS